MLYLYTDITLWTGRDYGLGLETLDEVLVSSFTLHYTYHGTDILAMYTLLIVAAPVGLLLLAIGQWRWVLLLSWLWWLAFQGYPEQASLPWYIRHGENFPIAAWQVLFVTGMVIGYHRVRITAWFRRWPQLRVVLAALAIAVSMALISLFTNVEAGTVPAEAPFAIFDVQSSVLDETFYKVSLRPWRLIAFAAVAIAAFTVVSYLWRPMRFAIGWLLLPLGQNALYAYIVHFFLILVIYNLAPFISSDLGGPTAFDTVLQLALVGALWGLIRTRFLFGVIPN